VSDDRETRYAKAIYAEGAYCGDCSYEGWGECSDCVSVNLSYARAAIALADADRAILIAAARDVVTDYASTCCDDLDGCACSMARLHRLVTPTEPAPARDPAGLSVGLLQVHPPNWEPFKPGVYLPTTKESPDA
jgi:hypothetical protein